MLYTKIQSQSFLGSGEEDFKASLPYIVMAAILFNGVEPFKQNVNTLCIEGPCKIWWKLLKLFQRRRHLKITQIYLYLKPRDNLIVTKKFTTLLKHCMFQPLVFSTFWENVFSKFPQTNVWGHKFDIDVKKSKVIRQPSFD